MLEVWRHDYQWRTFRAEDSSESLIIKSGIDWTALAGLLWMDWGECRDEILCPDYSMWGQMRLAAIVMIGKLCRLARFSLLTNTPVEMHFGLVQRRLDR